MIFPTDIRNTLIRLFGEEAIKDGRDGCLGVLVGIFLLPIDDAFAGIGVEGGHVGRRVLDPAGHFVFRRHPRQTRTMGKMLVGIAENIVFKLKGENAIV